MHSWRQAEHRVAAEWLNSFGDDDECESMQDGSTRPSSPSEFPSMSDSSPSPQSSRGLHVGKSTSRLLRGPKGAKAVSAPIGDKRMKGDYRSGCRGVSWNRRMQAWLAFFMDGSIRRSKTFSSKIHGVEEARQLAIEFITEKRIRKSLSSGDDTKKDSPMRETQTASRSRRAGSSTRENNLSSVTTGVVEIVKSFE